MADYQKEYASKGVAGAGLGLGIAGTALGLGFLSGGLGRGCGGPGFGWGGGCHGGGMGGAFGAINYGRAEAEQSIIAQQAAQIAQLKSERFTLESLNPVNAQIQGIQVHLAHEQEQLKALRAETREGFADVWRKLGAITQTFVPSTVVVTPPAA